MPRSPKGRAAARGLDACLSLQHAFMPAGDASLKTLRSIKMLIDSNHGIYREPGGASGRSSHVRSCSVRYRSGEPLDPTKGPFPDSGAQTDILWRASKIGAIIRGSPHRPTGPILDRFQQLRAYSTRESNRTLPVGRHSS